MAQVQQPTGFSSSPMTAAILGPDILARQLRLQQDAQYGQSMLDQGQQVPQGQMVSGRYVAPSWTQYLANGLKTYMGRQTLNNLPNEMAGLGQAQIDGVNRIFGVPGTTTQPAGAAPSSAPQPSPSVQAFSVGDSGQPQNNQPVPTAQPVDQSPAMVSALRGQTPTTGSAFAQPTPMAQPRLPLLPGKTRQESAQAYMMLGPQGYMNAVVTQGAPTDIVKNMVAAGIDPNSPQGRAYLANVLNKNASNLVNVRPGGTVFDANAGQPLYHAPGTNGVQVAETPRGPVMYNVPGSTGAVAAASTAQAAGPATFKTQIVNNPDGSNTLTTTRAIGEQVQNQPAPLRNNNPGALMPGGKIASYPTMEAGLQALDNNLASYGKSGVNTISGVISKWAPPNGNDTQAYIKDVATRLGVDPNQKIDLTNPLVRHAIGTAIALHESGPGAIFGSASQPGPQQGVQGGIPVQGEGTIAANQQLGKDQAKELMTSRAGAINATDDLTNIGQARKAISAGTFGGSGAQAKLNAAKFFQSWVPGMQDFDASKVSNTDYLVSTLGKGLLTHAKALGYNPTDADATRIEAIIGTIGKDPQALTKILDYQELMANRAIQRHNLLVNQARQGGVQSAFDLNVSPQTGMPSTQEPASAAPATGSGFTIVGVR